MTHSDKGEPAERPAAPRTLSRSMAVMADPSAKGSSTQVQLPAGDGVSAEAGGPDSPDPTRYGDWERKGRCIDF